MSWQDPEFSPVQRSAQPFSPTLLVVQVVPPGSHSPFGPISPDSGPSFCRAAPRAPQSAGGHTCPDLAASPCSQLPGMGSAQVVRAHERRRKGVSLWSASSCDLGPPSLYLSLPATYGSFPLRSSLAAPPHAAPPRPPITSAPVALLWIRVTRGKVRMQSPRIHSQRSDPGGHTVGPGNLNFYQASQCIGGLGCRGSCEHSEKHLIDLPLTSVGPRSRVQMKAIVYF